MREERVCIYIYTRQLLFPLAHAHESFTTPDLGDLRCQLYAADHGRRSSPTAETFTASRWRESIQEAEDDVERPDVVKDEVLTDDYECVSTPRIVASGEDCSIGRHLPKAFTRDEVR